MIASRASSLFRLNRVSSFASSYVISRPFLDFQIKKHKKVDLVGRSISAQASTHEELAVKDEMIDSEEGSQVQEVQVVSSGTDIGSDTTHADNEMVSSEKHSISVEVGSLMRFIKEKGGSTQKKIEEDMGVKILFPSSKEDSIVIEGSSADGVARASKKIQAIIDETVQSRSLDYSHFVSLPLAIHPELVDKLLLFQKCILGTDGSSADVIDTESSEHISEGEDGEGSDQPVSNVAVKLNVEDGHEQVKVDITRIPLVSYAPKAKPKASESSSLSELGIDESIFIKPKTFHLTVLMLKLWNKERVALATEVLQSISSKVIDALDNRPIFIRLKGLDCMKGSLAKARVLYVPVGEIGSEGRLLRACQVIINAYTEAGLVLERDAKQTLKLHATVMNARHRKWKKTKTRTKMADSFDARGIFKQYGSEEWGDYLIREAHLSQRFVFDDNGYYHRCASIPFPERMQLD
ncbi:uncharacterized protein LOC116200987 isoform X2 [Punica granatum]|uniref:Uncharacterized protein LOC116200987 isoform X2 n=1 Tax=Punica granatum TaxID=22663 RepID=A0A6P8D9J0_PUNGR|nr:uncharacterized protein LOC116200987 isoform X2 [Punica granatum]